MTRHVEIASLWNEVILYLQDVEIFAHYDLTMDATLLTQKEEKKKCLEVDDLLALKDGDLSFGNRLCHVLATLEVSLKRQIHCMRSTC